MFVLSSEVQEFVSCHVWTWVKVYENAKVHDTTGLTGLIRVHGHYCRNIKYSDTKNIQTTESQRVLETL